MSKKTRKWTAEAVADALGYVGQRRADFIQGWVNDPKFRYGRNALAKQRRRALARKAVWNSPG